MHFFKAILITIIVSISISACSSEQIANTPDINFNSGWLFKRDTLLNAEFNSFDDTNWRVLDLPHDWAIEGPFSTDNNARNGGLPIDGEAWYRKHFTVAKSDQGKVISIAFEGVMDNSKVWINGHFVGERPYGYIGFEYDISDFVNFGEDNVIAVQLKPEVLSHRWYAGAGIYRNVFLKINNPVHIPKWGTFITTPVANSDIATLSLKTNVKNSSSKKQKINLQTVIYDYNNNQVASRDSVILIAENTEKQIDVDILLEQPHLWTLEQPLLYKAISKVIIENELVDEYETPFGVRTIAFDKEKGFMLNEKQIKFQGVCLHHDQGPLGTAVNYRAKERQIQILKTMGVNALRVTHNPPSQELMGICDKYGIVVIIEAFDEWRKPKVKNGYGKYYDQWHEQDLRDMIRINRNHPSVIMWSIGNEILEQKLKDGWKETKHLTEICHEEDNTRPTTAGFSMYPEMFSFDSYKYVDVVGLNYKPLQYKTVLEQYPDIILYGSETSSQTSSRGEYHLPLAREEQKETKHVSSYDVTDGPRWAYAPDIEFDALAENPKVMGEFIWTGFDYLGEPTPYGGRDHENHGYWNKDWPSRSSYFAPIDLCGFPKDRFYLYQSQWTEKPMVHVLPHWNWEGKEGDIIPVFSYTNCDEVELFVNGKSYGRKVKGVETTPLFAELKGFEKGIYESKYRIHWNVPYQPGSLKVVGYIDGEIQASKEIKTAGTPAMIKLTADRDIISSDGKDLSFITVEIQDSEGNICPKAANLVDFKIKGSGKIVAVGNGDQTSVSPYQANYRNAFNGLCMVIVKSSEKSGLITLQATSEGLQSTEIKIKTE